MSLVSQICDPGLSRDRIVIVQADLLLFDDLLNSTNITNCDMIIAIGGRALRLDALPLMLSNH